MKKLTPEQLYKRLEYILEQYPGISARCVKFAVQLETLTAFPKGEFVGAYWDSEYGVIVYSNKSDKPYITKYATEDSALYWAKSPSVHWSLQGKNTGKTEKPRRGRPKKDWAGEYMTILEYRDQGKSVEEICDIMSISTRQYHNIKANYQRQKNEEMG